MMVSASEVQRDDAVLLGLGLATLVASNGPAVKVGDYDGVRI